MPSDARPSAKLIHGFDGTRWVELSFPTMGHDDVRDARRFEWFTTIVFHESGFGIRWHSDRSHDKGWYPWNCAHPAREWAK